MTSSLVPRSSTPAKQALYEALLGRGLEYRTTDATWHSPEARAFGRLEYAPDLSWARVQAPSHLEEGALMPTRGPALLSLLNVDGQWREVDAVGSLG